MSNLMSPPPNSNRKLHFSIKLYYNIIFHMTEVDLLNNYTLNIFQTLVKIKLKFYLYLS